MYQDYKTRRAFASEIMEASFFGAFMIAIDARKSEENLTQAELAKRTGREKTGISKLLAGPRNWQLSTMSDLAEALDVRIEFVLVDQHNPTRRFTQTGVAYIGPNQSTSAGPSDYISNPINMIDSNQMGRNLMPLSLGQNIGMMVPSIEGSHSWNANKPVSV